MNFKAAAYIICTVLHSTIIIANDFDESLGAYQEYLVLVYYKNSGLNTKGGGYFEEEGILVYHVNASLFSETVNGEIIYDVYNNNTSSKTKYGTKDNLIEYVCDSEGGYVFGAGETLPAFCLDSEQMLKFTFTVDALSDASATITITRNK